MRRARRRVAAAGGVELSLGGNTQDSPAGTSFVGAEAGRSTEPARAARGPGRQPEGPGRAGEGRGPDRV